ncbi:MAG: hypothetical protein ACFHX7_00835 [Pseudomonadota bacterium]
MSMTHRTDQTGLMTTRVAGQVTIADMLDGFIETGELTAYGDEIWHLVVVEPDIVINRDTRARMESAHNAKELVQFKTRGAIALVTHTPKATAFCQLIAGLLRGDAVPVVVFTNEDDARHWLQLNMHYDRGTGGLDITRTGTGF